jgi:hypothetical protein
MASGNGMSSVIILGVVGLGGWYLYESGLLGQWFGAAFYPPGVLPTTGTVPVTSTTPVTTPAVTTSTPTTTATTAVTTPTAAVFQIVGTVKPNINNSLTANVSINGGTPINLSIIQTNAQAYNTAGQNVTAALTAQGVNVPALLAAMQAAAGSLPGAVGGGTAGIGFASSRVPMNLINNRMGYRTPRGVI